MPLYVASRSMCHTTESMNCAGFCATLKLMAVQFFDIIQTYLFYSPGYFIVWFFFLIAVVVDSRSRWAPSIGKILFIIGFFRRKGLFIFFSLVLLLASTVCSLDGQNPSLINSIFSQVQVERYTVVYCKLCARTGAPCVYVCVCCAQLIVVAFLKSNGNSLSHCHQPPSASISINKKLCWTAKLSN